MSERMAEIIKDPFALIQDPDLLLLDEPTNNLDQAGIDSIGGPSSGQMFPWAWNRLISISTWTI